MKLSTLSCVTLALGAVLASRAAASDVTFSTTAGPIAIGGSATVGLPQFDGSLGVLRVARVSVYAEVSGTWSVENLNASPASFGGYASGTYVGTYVPVSAPAAFMFPPNPAFILDPCITLAAFDGVADYAGASGTVLAFSGESGDGAPSQYADVYADGSLVLYSGAGSVAVTLGPIGQVGPTMPPGFQTATTRTVNVWVNVRYTYDAFNTRICRATSGSGCPCGNYSPALNGCGNSVGVLGGSLDSAGTSSLSSDSLLLGGTGMTNSSALYFQGSAFSYAQTPYGDGLRCVTGSVVRLGTKANVNGFSQYPTAGDAPVSVRGGVTTPGTRFYQVIYRDGGSFCTSSSFNATNGLAVLWNP